MNKANSKSKRTFFLIPILILLLFKIDLIANLGSAFSCSIYIFARKLKEEKKYIYNVVCIYVLRGSATEEDQEAK